MGYNDWKKRVTGQAVENNSNVNTGGYASWKARVKQAAAEKQLIKSYDTNNDSIVDIRDVVRAKKITNNSNEYAQEINKQATDDIKKTIVSTDYFSGDFNGDLVVDKKDDKIYKQNEELRKADVGALQAELDKLKVILENAEAKKSNTNKVRANTLTKKGAASIEAFKQKDISKQDYDEYLKSVGYSSIEDIQKDITEKTAFLNNAKRIQNRIKLSSVNDSASENYDPEFDKYKEEGYKVSYKNIGNEILSFGGGAAASGVAVDNYRAAALALFEHLGNEIPKKYTQKDTDEKISIYREMSFDEFKKFAYYLGKDKENGTDSAKEYIDAITDELNYRRGSEIADDIKDKDILRYLYTIPTGIDQFASGTKSLFNTNGEYKATSAIQYASSQIGEEIYKEDGAFGKGIYDLGTTTVNMLPSILASTAANLIVPGSGAVIGAGLIGASAGGNGYQEMINLGYDKKQAQAYGVLVGASEAALGYAFSGISAIGGKVTGNVLNGILDGIDNGLAKFAIKYGGSMLSEGFEEAAQEILTPLFENIALQYDKNSFKDINWDEVVYSGLLGAISAGLLEGAPAISDASYEAGIAKAEKLSFNGDTKKMQIFADEALAGNSTDSEAYKLALKYKQRLDNNKKLSGTQLHKLREAYESAIKENDKVKIKNAVAARLEELGETANIPELSDIITRGVAGEKVTKAEQNTVKSSKYGEQVTNEFAPIDKSFKKELSSYWTELIETEHIHSDVYNKTDSVSNDNKNINELEEKILAKSDETLTPTERAIKQSIYERRSRREGLNNDDDALREQGKFTKPVEEAIETDTETKMKDAESDNNNQRAENNSTNAKNDLDSMLDESDSDPQEETEERAPFTEPSSKEIHRKATDEEGWNIFLGVYENNVKQRHITDVAKKLDPDMKVIWAAKSDDRLSGKNGKYIRSINTMILSKDASVAEMYFEVFKHEFMHRLESKGSYIAFKKYLFEKSTAFEQYIRAQLKIINKGKSFDGSREEAINALTKYYFDKFQNDKSIGKPLKDKFTLEDAQREIVADFAGEVLFKGKANKQSIAKALSNEDMLSIGEIESTIDALEELAKTDRNLFQRIMDVIKDFIRMLIGQPQTKSLVKDLEYIEKRLARVYDSADTKKAAKNSGEINFSFNSIYSKESRFIVDAIYENANNISKKDVFSVKREAIPDDIKKSEYVLNIFKEQGKIAKNSIIGEVELAQSGAKSTVFHGFGAEKLAATKAIKSVIENGDIIKKTENYNNSGIDRYVIAAKGTIESKPAYVGVIVKTYPKQKNEQAKFYLHEAVIIETDSPIMTAPQLSVDAVSESVTNDIIDDIVPTVNSKSMQETENYSSDESFSIGSPMQQARESLAKYESGEITREEYLAGLEENYWSREAEWAKEGAKLKGQLKAKSKERAEVKAEVIAEREEKATKQSNIEHIRKTVSRIDKMFRTNSDQKHIPEKLKEASAYFIKIFVNNDASPFEKKEIRDIRTLYNDLITEGDDGVEINGVDEKTVETLKKLEEKLDGKTLKQLNNSEILLIKEITDNFYHIIKDENEVFIEGKKQKLAGIGQRCIDELKVKKAKRENALMRQLDANIKYSNMIPIYFFEEIGGVLNEAFVEVVKGQDKWYQNVAAAKKHIGDLKKKYHYKDWDDKTLKLTTEKGDKIEITREQAMLLVATARREYGNKYKESMHLFKGGVVIPPSKNTIADIVKRYNKAVDKEEVEIRRKITKEIDSRAHRITPKDAQAVLEWLTKEQVEYVEAMTDYLSNDMAARGNEISMELTGIKKYGEKYYIPYNSAENFLFSQPGVNQEARLKHQSFTKDTQHRANTPIVLSDFSTVCADHINRMCMYNALTVPLENMNKIFNYQSKGDDTDTLDVKAEIERVYGQAAVKYIKDFLKDMNGNVRNEEPNSLMAKTLRLFKKGAVFASASVVVQQPSAVMRAMTYIDPKYFTETTFKFAERSFKEATEWASVAGIKQMGRFDTGMGATTVEWLLYEKPEGLKNKTKAFFDVSDSTYRDDFLSAPAAKADELAWGHIWAAVKAEIADTTDLKQGSKEFFETCAERFTEVINYTQVYDSTISRSQNMRNKSVSAQMLTAFMSEPTVTLNCLMKAIREAKANGKEGKMFASRAIAAVIGNVILNSLLKSLVTAGRDDDDDYTYIEKYAANVIQNIESDINPFSMIPYIKDIVSVFEGYSVDRADMSLFSDLAQSVRDINSDNKTVLQKTESLAGSLAAFLGLPVKNVLRDVRTVYNIVMDMQRNLSNGKTDSDWTGIWYALNESSNAEIFEDLASAAESGDEAKYQRIYKHLSDIGKTDSQIISGIKKAYSNSKEIKTGTQQYLDKLKGNTTYEMLDDEDKEKVRKEITSKLALQKTVVAIFNNSSRFDTLYSYYRRGQTEKYNKVKKELADEGFTASQISNGLEYARLSYMQSVGVDIHEYLLYKKAVSKKYADTDDSGSVEKSEKKKAINNMDSDSKVKNFFINEYK